MKPDYRINYIGICNLSNDPKNTRRILEIYLSGKYSCSIVCFGIFCFINSFFVEESFGNRVQYCFDSYVILIINIGVK